MEAQSSEHSGVLVSVVIPCYNAERFIVATLTSVQQQTLPKEHIEIVVVDDGSTDRSPALIREFSLPGLTLLCTPNRGVSHARNLGTARSTGKFIQYLDADDLLRPDALRKRIEVLEATGADVAYSAWQRLVEDEHGNYVSGEVVRRRIEEVSPDVELALFSSFWSPPVALLYRRRVVERIGAWDADYPVIQDARFLQDAAHHGATFAFVDEVLGEYRTHRSASLSRRNRLEFEKDILSNNQATETRWRQKGCLTDERRAYLCSAYRRSADFFFWQSPDLFATAHRHSALSRASEAFSRADLYAWAVRRWGWVLARRMFYPFKAAKLWLRRALRAH